MLWQLMIEKRSEDICFCEDEVKTEFVFMIRDCFVSTFNKLALKLRDSAFWINSDSASEFVGERLY